MGTRLVINLKGIFVISLGSHGQQAQQLDLEPIRRFSWSLSHSVLMDNKHNSSTWSSKEVLMESQPLGSHGRAPCTALHIQ
ncbi:hypothetical protein Syun_016869 [Stephania yunnanensis]|uniref:Uncharacterized protein n=1 Tax=Stephania yunnanensis TaxID=152371 RepID=A0AAP0J880_9MAGN